jgi:farnesyl-diphosphate farnesyltransferase
MDSESLDDLLLETSRTFALTIPLLPEPTRRAVCLAYLLFRVSDTFEDASTWTREERIAALSAWCDVLRAPSTWGQEARALAARWLAKKPSEHEGYLRLVENIPGVLSEVGRLEEARRTIVVAHAVRSAEGMAEVLRSAEPDGWVRLSTLEDLRAYCYVVAGIVGELLTSLFLHDAPVLSAEAPTLRAHERAFGEALQLVNILKDERDDESEGRRFLPVSVRRADVVDLARQDLRHAETYTAALARGGAPPGFVAFTAMPAELAKKSLDRVEEDGAGAKVPRGVVLEMMVRYKAMAAGLR